MTRERTIYDAVSGIITLPVPAQPHEVILYAQDHMLTGMWTDADPNQVLITSIINLASGQELCPGSGMDLAFFNAGQRRPVMFDFGSHNVRLLIQPFVEPKPGRTVKIEFQYLSLTRSSCDSFVQEQATPTKNTHPAVWDLVIADMRARDEHGRREYGTPLQPFNGRDPIVDAYQESLDQTVYLRQAIYEKNGR